MPSTIAANRLTDVLKETKALLEGHFLLSSGLHSDRYFQCAKLMQYPQQAEWICRQLAGRITETVDVVVGPAMGGIVVAYELARALDVRSFFTERVDGVMTLRRGFQLQPGERVLVVEDVVTTGLSAREAAAAIQAEGGQVVAIASLVDRSAGTVDFGVPFHSLLSMQVETFPWNDCPHCRAGLPVVKPGSRAVTAQA